MRFSIIIPVYNGLEFLKDAIDSVLAQTSSHYEIIIVDDASNQNIREFLERYFAQALSAQTIRYFRNSMHMERCYSRNLGVEQARGDMVAFLDHDDRYQVNHLFEADRVFSNHPEVEFVYSVPEEFIDYANRIVFKRSGAVGNYDLVRSALTASFITSGIIMRKKAFCRIGQFHKNLTQREDYELACRAIMEYRLETEIIRKNSVQVRGVKSPELQKIRLCRDDPYFENTKLAKEIIERYSFMRDQRKARLYLPDLYMEVANVAITFHDLRYAFKMFIKAFSINPYKAAYARFLMRWIGYLIKR